MVTAWRGADQHSKAQSAEQAQTCFPLDPGRPRPFVSFTKCYFFVAKKISVESCRLRGNSVRAEVQWGHRQVDTGSARDKHWFR